jgi:small subunit ribosomal protein S29e
MTAKDYSKAYNQLQFKPGKWIKYQKHNKPKNRSYGKSVSKCKFTGNTHGVIRKYGLNMCRRYFRANANKLGFYKYR